MRDPRNVDPSQTAGERRRYFFDIKRRLEAITRDAIAFLAPNPKPPQTMRLMANQGLYEWLTDPQKVAMFREWLDRQIKSRILTAVDKKSGKPWFSKYVANTRTKAKRRAFDAVRKEAKSRGSEFHAGSFGEFQLSFGTEIETRKLEMLFTRNYTLLKGMTDEFAKALTLLLTEGLSQSKHPREIARDIRDATNISLKKALQIARTEIVHVQAESLLDSYEKLDVSLVGVWAELVTAWDDRVCSICNSLSGKVYSIKEARNIIPVHPNCRCTWLPVTGETRPRRRRVVQTVS